MFGLFRNNRRFRRRLFAPPMLTQKKSRRAALGTATILTLIAASVNVRPQAAGSAPPPANTDVPVKEVVLFSSGVGYFQHEGTVRGDASTELRFKTTQINDILKSLVLNDLDGGHVGVVTYPSQAPLDKTLASFQVDISDNPSEGRLLDKLRGARISLGYSGANGLETTEGTILGVEEREVPGGKEGAAPLKKEFLNLVTNGGICSLDLARVERFQLEDRNLQEELSRALAAVAGARDQDKKPVDVRFNGQGERHVRLGYVVETPIWKASYRLVLPGKDGKDKQGMLQGWAIVDNQTDNDWKDVRLSLISGRPISFIQDLYQPLYVPRPKVVPELYASLRPQEYEGGQENKAAVANAPVPALEALRAQPQAQALGGGALDQGAVAASGGGARDNTGVGSSAPPPMNVSESVTPLSDTAKIGELFQYTVGNVSLARQNSAMIPIINDPVEVEKVSIYNHGVLATHPLNGARLKNTTEDKKHLLAGPVTVFDGGRYAGDARIDDVPPGQRRLLSYGVDLEMLVNADNLEDKQSVQTGKIVKGVLEVTYKSVSAVEYSAENKGDDDRVLVTEHPLREGWKLVGTPAPVETTDRLYRFQQSVGPGKTVKFTVREEDVENQEIGLRGTDLNNLLEYSKTGEFPVGVRDALTKVIARHQAIQATQDQVTEKDDQTKALSEDQARIRENIKSVDRTSAYATRLLKKLDDQESQLEKLHSEADALRAKLDAERKEYEASLNNLNVG